MHDLKLKGAARNTIRLCIHDENMSACVCVCVCLLIVYFKECLCALLSLSLSVWAVTSLLWDACLVYLYNNNNVCFIFSL